jgi:hypothetical protein
MPPELIAGEVDWFYNMLGISNDFLWVFDPTSWKYPAGGPELTSLSA